MVHGKLNNQTRNKHTDDIQHKNKELSETQHPYNQNDLNNHSFSSSQGFLFRVCEVCIKEGFRAHFN